MAIKIKYILLSIILVGSCGVFRDAPLSLERQDYGGMEINLEGYWWKWVEGSLEPRIFVLFLYDNGIVLSGLSFSINDIEEKEASYSTQMFRDLTLRSKTDWGVFQVDNEDIDIEMWVSSNNGPLKTLVRSGEILDNETFLITSMLNNYSGETTARNDTFYFKEFSPKPDSTNPFIK